MAKKINSPHILVVEGKDEEAFFDAFCKHHQLSDIQVFPVGGKTQFRSQLGLLRLSSEFDMVSAMGVIRDADDRVKSAFDSVCGALTSNNLSKPTDIGVFSTDSPKTGILIMPPGNEGTGRMLEDLCLAAVAEDDAIQCIDSYFQCLSDVNIRHRDTAIAKARLHAFLASRQEPDLRLGEAAQKRYIPFDHPVFSPIEAFLRELSET